VDVEEFPASAPDRPTNDGPDRDRRYEVSVHDVDVNPVGARLVEGFDFRAESD